MTTINKLSASKMKKIFILLLMYFQFGENFSQPYIYHDGTGSSGKIAKFTTNATTIGSSIIWEYNSKIGIGMTSQNDISAKLTVANSSLTTLPVFQSKIIGLGEVASVKHLFNNGSHDFGVYQEGSGLLNYFQGKIGIGESDPQFTLDVNGDIGCTSTLNFFGSSSGISYTGDLDDVFDFKFYHLSVPDTVYTPLSVHYWGLKVHDTLKCNNITISNGAGSGKVLLSDESGNGLWSDPSRLADTDWIFGGFGNELLYSNPTVKKVGIATDNPSQTLEICTTDSTGGIAINQLDTIIRKSEIKFNVAGIEQWAIGNEINPERRNSFFIWNHNRSRVEFFIGDNGMTGISTMWPNATLDVNGSLKADHVGIGTDAPAAIDSTWKLFVEGGIKAREILVTVNPFSDYVFEKDYRLMSLFELENYITANGHLPGIPSAAEVEKDGGIAVGDFQTKLLAKIEEQSLYIISLQKQIDELKAMISSIKNTK